MTRRRLPRLGSPLSSREIEVLALVAAGYSNARIGAELNIAFFTVKSHLARICSKLGTASRTEAATIAIGKGLIKAPAGPQQHPDTPTPEQPPAAPAPGPRPRSTGTAVPLPAQLVDGMLGVVAAAANSPTPTPVREHARAVMRRVEFHRRATASRPGRTP